MTDVAFDEIQGNILNGYGADYGHAWYLMVAVPSAQAGQNLLSAVLPALTTATRWNQGARPGSLLNVAISYAGFRQLGLSSSLLERFPMEFRTPTRARAADLGDVGASAPERWDAGLGDGSVHLLLTVHGRSERAAGDAHALVLAMATERGATVVSDQRCAALSNKREHFGYADGRGQPAVEDVPRLRQDASPVGGGVPLAGGGWRPVRLGEFVLGYPDEEGAVAGDPCPELAWNGSYLVYRKLEQDVARFEQSLSDAAECSGLSEELIAAKVVGRWRDGRPLQLATGPAFEGNQREHMDPTPSNDFRYLPDDRLGYGCPRGAHIRRANPRDSLDFGEVVRESGRLTARHRIIRRGMPYGSEWHDNPSDTDRGLIFVCYNADIVRQFEILQAQWCMDGDAFGLGDDQDFLLAGGRDAKMTIPVAGSHPRFIPVRGDLVLTRGSEYLFAPSRSALRKLAAGAFS